MAHKVFIAALSCRKLPAPDSNSCRLLFAWQKLLIPLVVMVFNPLRLPGSWLGQELGCREVLKDRKSARDGAWEKHLGEGKISASPGQHLQVNGRGRQPGSRSQSGKSLFAQCLLWKALVGLFYDAVLVLSHDLSPSFCVEVLLALSCISELPSVPFQQLLYANPRYWDERKSRNVLGTAAFTSSLDNLLSEVVSHQCSMRLETWLDSWTQDSCGLQLTRPNRAQVLTAFPNSSLVFNPWNGPWVTSRGLEP